MTKQQEKEFEKIFKEKLKEAHFQGLKGGTAGILGAVLNMCNEGKTVDDIREFCKSLLNMEEKKK